MGYVDLHVHSSASDGTLTPAQVTALACECGLDAIALTDHDTVKGIEEAVAAAEGTGLEVVPGTELSCVYEGTEIHIVGLFVRTDRPQLAQSLNRLEQIRRDRNLEMLRRFRQDGILLTEEELTGGRPDTVITRAHFARALTEKGYAPSVRQAFHDYLEYGGPYCVRKEIIQPEQVMELLRENGAFPVLAHPFLYHMDIGRLDTLTARLTELGLKGLEVYHSSNTASQTAQLQPLARKYGLLPSGGSDFHGANKPDIRLGVGRGNLRLSRLLLEDIRRAAGL